MKLNVPATFDTSETLATDPGKTLENFIRRCVDVDQKVISLLQNGLTFGDNFSCKILVASLKTGVEQNINTDKKTPIGVIPLRVLSSLYGFDSFLWYVNDQGQTVVKAGLSGSPSATDSFDCTLAVLFG